VRTVSKFVGYMVSGIARPPHDLGDSEIQFDPGALDRLGGGGL
jgi:hypothetical protein